MGALTHRVREARESKRAQSPGAVRSKIQRTGRLGGQTQIRGRRTGAVRSPIGRWRGTLSGEVGALLAGGERRRQVWSGYAGYGGLTAGEVAILNHVATIE